MPFGLETWPVVTQDHVSVRSHRQYSLRLPVEANNLSGMDWLKTDCIPKYT